MIAGLLFLVCDRLYKRTGPGTKRSVFGAGLMQVLLVMNILYISSKKGWGGVVTWMYRTAVALEKRGHRVWIISHPESRFTRSAPRDANVVPKRLGMDFNPVMIAYLVNFIKKRRIDLIVTNIQKEVIIGGLAARICGIPNIRRIGNEDDLNDRIRWRQMKLVDHSIVPSDFTLKQAAKRVSWLDVSRFTTIYNGVDPIDHTEEEIAEVRGRWGLAVGQTVVGCTSGLAEVKGIDGLIRAFGKVAAEYANVFLVLNGEGPEEAALRGLAQALHLEDRVVFAGFTTEPTRVAAAYDIAVLNSSLEGFPNVLIEYMAAGRPVISTRVGGIAEILLDRVNGLLIEAGDEAALVDRLRTLIASPGLRKELGLKARKTIEDRFSGGAMVDKVEDLFREVIAKPRLS